MMRRSITINGNVPPRGALSARRFLSALFLNKCVGHGAQVVCYADKVIDAEVQPHGGVLILHVDHGVIHPVKVGEGADINVAIGRYLDPFHGRTLAHFAMRVQS